MEKELLALEFGYKQCEKGNNLEHAISEYVKLAPISYYRIAEKNNSVKEMKEALDGFIRQAEICDYQTSDGLHDLKMNKYYQDLKQALKNSEL